MGEGTAAEISLQNRILSQTFILIDTQDQSLNTESLDLKSDWVKWTWEEKWTWKVIAMNRDENSELGIENPEIRKPKN